jgi:hypothetical protein
MNGERAIYIVDESAVFWLVALVAFMLTVHLVVVLLGRSKP